VETSQRLVDVVLGALAKAAPELVPAASQGTMNNVAIGGRDPRRGDAAFAYYETLGGGLGASARGPGLSAVHVHMSNTLNTPIEALELAYPVRVREYALRRGSGGEGRHRGGEGLVREIEFLAPATVTVLSERRRFAPPGAAGGGPGAKGRNVLRRASGEVVELAGKFALRVEAGDALRIETPGGGGYGHPQA
jgi:N-methylhydantoinase B